MTYINWILIGLFVIALGLFITSYIIKNETLKKITSIFLLPLLIANPLIILFDFLPNSFHCIQFSIIALVFFWIFQILMIFNSKMIISIFSKLSFLFGILTLDYYYRTVFFIYKVPAWLTILSSILLAGIILATAILSVPKPSVNSLKIRFFSIILHAATAILVFCSFISFINTKTAGSAILFAGALILFGNVIFYLIDGARLKLKFAKEIRQSAILISLFAVCLSNLMIFI